MRGACLIVSVSVANLCQEALGLWLGCLYYIDLELDALFSCVCVCVCVYLYMHMCVGVMVNTNDYLAASFNPNQVEL